MDQLLSIIGQMYDASLDPSLWSDVLKQISAYLHVLQAALVIEDVTDPSASVFYTSFVDPDWTARYIQTFMLINPMRLATVANVDGGDVILTTDFMTPDEYSRTPFAREWLAARRVTDIAVAVLDKTATSITVLSVHRGYEHGFADEEVRQKLRQLVPHAQRAVRIGQLFERKRIEAATLAETLDTLAAAVVLVDEQGTILHANMRANHLLATDDLAKDRVGRLSLWDRQAEHDVRQAITAAARGDLPPRTGERVIAARSRSGEPYGLTILPLISGRRSPIAARYRAAAAVCMRPAAFEMPPATPLLASHYDLTRREFAILTAVVELGSTADVASAMGLSEATVKSHLKSIFRKTGATRQSDLVKLVVATSSPLQ